MVGLGAAGEPGVAAAVVVEPEHLVRPHRRADRQQHLLVDLRAAAAARHGGDLEGVGRGAQAGGHDLAERRERAHGGLVDPRDAGGGGLQGDDEGDRLLVVEQERRHLGAGVEPVAAVGSLARVHGVAELAQAVDVAAHGPWADAEPVGERLARPVAARLQQRQQRRGVGRTAWTCAQDATQ